MAEVKVVISDVKSGKSYQKVAELDDFIGKKIGDKLDGGTLGLEDYELEVSGGSDDAGFPMRPDIEGSARKKGLFSGGVGVTVKKQGNKIRKSVRGNVVSENTAQVNVKVVKAGKKSVEDCLGIKKEEPKEEPKKEDKKSEKKEEAPKESKEAPKEKPKEEVPKEKPKEDKPKEEVKEEKPVAKEKKE